MTSDLGAASPAETEGIGLKSHLEDTLPEVRFALDAVEKASMLAATVQSSLNHRSLVKKDRSPVTVADLAVQALIARMLQSVFPEDSLVAEEEASEVNSPLGSQLLESAAGAVRAFLPDASAGDARRWVSWGENPPRRDRFWTLDPIDGTKGFLRGEQYAVALSLLVDSRPRIGVLGCPKLRLDGQEGVLAIAVEGQGAWTTPLHRRNYRRLQVSGTSRAEDARVLRSVEAGHTDSKGFDRFLRHFGTSRPPMLMDSQTKYAFLAAGQGDLLLRMVSPARPGYREKIWDHAAGALIVEEAGGRVTDLHGSPLDFSQGRRLEKNVGVAASNGALHETALDALASI